MHKPDHQFLDALVSRLNLRNDAALSRTLGVKPPQISKIRHGAAVSPSMILRVHEITGIPVKELRELSTGEDHAQ